MKSFLGQRKREEPRSPGAITPGEGLDSHKDYYSWGQRQRRTQIPVGPPLLGTKRGKGQTPSGNITSGDRGTGPDTLTSMSSAKISWPSVILTWSILARNAEGCLCPLGAAEWPSGCHLIEFAATPAPKSSRLCPGKKKFCTGNSSTEPLISANSIL